MAIVHSVGSKYYVDEHTRKSYVPARNSLSPMCLEAHPIEVLAELSVLLEEYAPSWYVEGLRDRVLAALRTSTDEVSGIVSFSRT